MYLDSNVVLYAYEPQDNRFRAACRAAVEGATEKVTSAVTVDEVVWSMRRKMPYSRAVAVGKGLAATPGLDLVPVGRPDIMQALDIMEAHGLAPRDAIHAAVALRLGGDILSLDPDMDKVPGLRRTAP